MSTLASIDSFLGNIWWSALVFIAGTLLGAPLWSYVRKFFPWNKDS